MRIFVAGATGAVGRGLLPRLVRAGHSVVGLTRTPAKAGLIRTSAPNPLWPMPSMKGPFRLLAAARACGVKRMIAQSFCGWPYARSGGHIKSEEDPLDPNPPQELRRTLEAIRYLERVVTASAAPEGVVLRYGAFYGPDTGMFDPVMIEQVRKRRVPLIGSGEARWSFLHIDDAAEATALAVERGNGIYNIVDDAPAPVHEWLPALADMLGAKPPFRLPAWIARIVAGEHVVVMMTELRAGSNAKAKRELAWRPRYSSWRQGFAEIIQPKPRMAA